MSNIRNLYNVYDPAYEISTNFSIDENDWITASFDNSEGNEVKYLNFFCNVSKKLATNNIYYVFLEIGEVMGNGGIFVTDSATEKENFSELEVGDILRFKIATLDDFSEAKIMLKTYLQFFPGETGSLKFRISVLDEEIELKDFEYKKYGEDEYAMFIDGRGYLNIPEVGIRYLVDLRESNILDMPEATESTVRISGKDGDLVLNTTYEPRMFDIIAYTEDNLSPQEKIAEINKMTRFMNSIKNKTKRIALLAHDKMYPVKYNGQLIDTPYPMFVRFEIPLKSSEAYGMELVKQRLWGANSAKSNSIKETGFILTINGPAQTPVVSVNDYHMKYDNVVLDGNQLVINTKNSTVTMITSEGVKTNAALYYNHEYPKIQPGENVIKIHSGIDNPNQVLTEWYDLKL